MELTSLSSPRAFAGVAPDPCYVPGLADTGPFALQLSNSACKLKKFSDVRASSRIVRAEEGTEEKVPDSNSDLHALHLFELAAAYVKSGPDMA